MVSPFCAFPIAILMVLISLLIPTESVFAFKKEREIEEIKNNILKRNFTVFGQKFGFTEF